MRRKNVLRLSFIVAFLTLLWSCRNEDFAQAERNPQRNNQDFFKHTKNNDGLARTGVDYVDILEAYNKEKDFLAQMPDQKGMPIWEKMQVFDGGTATALIIPLSDDNEVLSSLLFATVDSKMQVLGVRNFDNALLREIVYDETISRDYREYLFSTFMMADHYTFGTTHFTNIPKDLFVKQKYNDDLGRISIKDISFSNVTSNENGRILIIKTCYIVLHCTHHGTGACDAIDGCTDCGTEYCTYSVVTTSGAGIPSTNTNPGGISSPGTGSDGGGSGTPTVIPDPDPCGLTKAFYRLAPNCTGNPEPIENPCEKIKNKFTQEKYKKKKDSIDKASFYKKRHETGFREQANGNLEDLPQSSSNSLSLTFDANTVGYTHVHVNDQLMETQNDQGQDQIEIKIRIHSPADVNTLMQMAEMNLGTGNFDNLYGTMLSSDGTYVIKFTGLATDINTSFGTTPEITESWRKKFAKYFYDKNKRTNETNFLLFLKNEMHVNGISLFKVKSDNSVYEIKLNDVGTKAVSVKCSN